MVADKTAGTNRSASTGTTGAAAGTQPADEEQGVGAAERAAPGKTAAKKAVAKKAVPAAKKAVAKKVVAKKAVPAAKKTAAKKTVGRKAAGKKTAPGEVPAREVPVKKASAKKAAAKKAVAGETASGAAAEAAGKQAAAAAEGTAEAAETGVGTVVAKKSTGGAATARKKAVPAARATTAVVPGELAVRPGEDPWTPEEVAEARAELDSEILRLRAEIASSEEALTGLMRDSGNGAGDDDADTGSKNITREHEMSLAANAREMLEQTERARDRLDSWTYGICENCGNPIGKARVQAFPRATLCVECKQKQERRY
ncbi:TraR/DksA family transcriptional regulator [Streptomyces sp. NPDC051561]|uniref:TraR/DksA family transcriptional regulator n=1 Tax=Streptomyces sp. NPDC051561 TaxID=3365658 RepID=UPI0037AD8EE5